MTLRDNTRIKRKAAGLVPAALRPLAYKLYSVIFESRFLAARRRDALQLPAHVLRCEIGYNQYGAYCVPASLKDRPAVKRILAGRVYEPDTLEFIRDRCGNGDIVHAGTFFGDFLPALSAGCVGQAKVWAFEPNPESYRCATITIGLNNLRNVNLVNAGLGAEVSRQRVQVEDESGHPLGGGSRIVSASDAGSGTEDVDIVTVDATVPADRAVSILQLDVEGYEQQALAGARQTIERCRPIIILEVPPTSTLIDSGWFRDNVLALGYRKTGDVHYNQVFESV